MRVEVTDTGPRPHLAGRGRAFAAPRRRSPAAGHGLRGMRERAAAAGGTIEIGPLPGGRLPGGGALPLDGQPATSAGSTAPSTATTDRRRRPSMIRVLLADDQALIRAGFRVLLEAADDIEVIGEAVNGDQAVELAKSERPDVILMDIRMPGTDGLAATQPDRRRRRRWTG